ncbi:MAG: hypothetical protein J6T15_04445 [Bacilli bacterium]|nr:hypothetical protein [Bacilli bacterium]
MKNKIKIICMCVISCSFLSCITACEESKENIEDFSLSESGILDWNNVKGASKYCISIYDNVRQYTSETWIESSEADLGSIKTETNGYYDFTVQAYKKKGLFSEEKMKGKEIKGTIAKHDSVYYLNEKIPKYDLKVNNSLTSANISESQQYKKQIIVDYKSLIDDIEVYIGDYKCFDVEGIYYDKNYNREIEDRFVLTSNTSLYAKITEKTAKISFDYCVGSPNIYDLKQEKGPIGNRTYKYTETFSLKDIEVPEIDGMTFAYWDGYKNCDFENLPSMMALTANDSYTAVYYKDITVFFISGPCDYSDSLLSHVTYTEYGSTVVKYKGQITEEMFHKYNPNTYDNYYWNDSYYWYSGQKTKFYNEIKGKSNSLPMEYLSTKKIYVWGENN